MSDSTTVADEPEAEHEVADESETTATTASDQLNITIQGEVHGSQKDMRALLSENLEEYDALFVEGRENVIALDEADSIGFELFTIGLILLRLSAYRMVDLLSRLISLLIGKKSIEPEAAANEAGIGYHDNIDRELHEIHQTATRRTRAVAWIVSLTAIAYLSVAILSSEGGTHSNLSLVVVTAAVPILYSGFIIRGVGTEDRSRDEVMTERLNETATENGYERVLLLCGNMHVTGIKDNLEEMGWHVDSRRSSWSIVPRVKRLFP